MNKNLFEEIKKELDSFDGDVGFYYKNLITQEEFKYNENNKFLAASIVKLPLIAVVYYLVEKGEISLEDKILIKDKEKKDACGVIKHMPKDIIMDLGTLCKLMIVISDTTATNAVFNYLGNEKVIDTLIKLDLYDTQFNRAYFDDYRESIGINNYFTPKEIGDLLEKIFKRELISEKASFEIDNILRQQQINHKICGKLPMDYPVSHKTGEEEDKTHDVGIVYSKEPFVICFASYKVDLYRYEDFIRRRTYDIVKSIDENLSIYDEINNIKLHF